MKIIFSERLKKNRLSKKMTQDQLAKELQISPQSVSKWERGDGYPDITLLPRIANFFSISVDELIGNDEATREDDIGKFLNEYSGFGMDSEGWGKKLELSKEYYRKYPQNFEIMDLLGSAIINNMDDIDRNIDLLRELHDKIMSGCTDEEWRRNSIHYMCYAAPDEKLDDLIGKSELNWSEAISIGQLREERFLLQHRFDDYRRERNATDLLIFMQYLGRNNMAYYGHDKKYTFDEPARTAAWELQKMRLLEVFDPDCREENGIPEAWCGCYAEFSLKAAGALIGSGMIDEGFARLEATFPLYERWNAIPQGKRMKVGNSEIFGDAEINKSGKDYIVNIYFADGYKVWTPYLWLFWQLKCDIYYALKDWPWFESVKNDPRYLAAFEKAKIMAGK